MKNKRYRNLAKKVEDKAYPLDEALKLVLENANAKFDESIELSLRLGVDPKQSDQQLRGSFSLPHGSGKKVKILVLAKGDEEKKAREAGADHVGSDEMIEKIKKGFMDFEKVIASPSMMKSVSKVAKILGPKGLMPNPKLGTVTDRVAEAVSSEKKGKLTYRVEKAGMVQGMIGKKSFGFDKLKENYLAFMSHIVKSKPSSSKGVFLRGVYMSSTMGKGVKLDTKSLV